MAASAKKQRIKREAGVTFARALQKAKTELAHKMQQRAAAEAVVATCNIEIPHLEQTIRALTAQLNPMGNLPPDVPRTSLLPVVMPFPASTANAPRTGPVEIDEGWGSVPAAVENMPQNLDDGEPDLDALLAFAGNFT